jgi:hypothetical protein
VNVWSNNSYYRNSKQTAALAFPAAYHGRELCMNWQEGMPAAVLPIVGSRLHYVACRLLLAN